MYYRRGCFAATSLPVGRRSGIATRRSLQERAHPSCDGPGGFGTLTRRVTARSVTDGGRRLGARVAVHCGGCMRSGLVGGVASLVVVAASCTDLPNEPTTPAAPRTVSVSPIAMQGGNGKTSLELRRATTSSGEDVSDRARTPNVSRGWATCLKRSRRRTSSCITRRSGTTRFRRSTRTRTGSPTSSTSLPRSLEAVWQREVVELRYPSPVGTPAQKFHVYYKDLTTYYGATYPENVTVQATSPVPLGTATAYIVVENDFYDGFPPNDEDVTGAETIRSGALKVTQAHEFMHAHPVQHQRLSVRLADGVARDVGRGRRVRRRQRLALVHQQRSSRRPTFRCSAATSTARRTSRTG